MKTMNMSNLVILLDGIKNNHEIELVDSSHKRVQNVLQVDSRYAYFLKDSKRFHQGKYIYQENPDEKLWICITASGDFSEKVNSDTIETIQTNSLLILNSGLTREQTIDHIRQHFQAKEKKQCAILFTVSQDELERKVKPRNSTLAEITWFKIQELNSAKFKSMFSEFLQKILWFPLEKLQK